MKKPFRYQETGEYFAQIAHPIEELGAGELAELGARKVTPLYRGIRFEADAEALYAITYGTRLCSRVLVPLIRFECHSDRYLYKTASDIDWSVFLNPDDTFAITSTVTQSIIRHSKYAALKLKDAIVDFFREQTGRRPSVDRHEPDVLFHLHLQNNRATISLDAAGGALHRRGYRTASVEAPMQETVAAAIVRMSGWEGERELYDPMCGSGTILAEALMHVCRIPAAYLRSSFGFERLPDFDPDLWSRLRKHMNSGIRQVPESGSISGSDIDANALKAAAANLAMLPSGKSVPFARKDVFRLEGLTDAVIITNPPYGLRIGRRDQIEGFYRHLGDFLKQKCRGSESYIYAGKRELLKHIGLRTTWKKPLVSGSLDGRLAKYELY